MKRLIFLSLSAALFMGCHTQNEQAIVCRPSGEDALAGIPDEYRPEMAEVLAHYENDADSLKYKAAIFLISNMPGHQSYWGPMVDEYHRQLDSIISSRPIEHVYKDTRRLSAAVNRLAESYPISHFETKEDYEILTSDFLIRNIDEAVGLWENGNWAHHLDFDDFCEFVLPYRISELYVPEDWRGMISSQIDSSVFNKLEDFQFSPEMEYSAFWACQVLNLYLKQKIDADKTPSDSPAVWKMSSKTRLPYGRCNDFCEIAALYMRSIGIPVAVDFTPQWPFRSWGHTWNTLLMNNGKTKSFGGCEQDPEMLHKVEQKMAKVYRKTYAINNDVREILSKEREVPDFMENPFIKDVSSEYMRTSDVTVEAKYDLFPGTCYLAVFDNRQWSPVCFGKKVGGKYLFEDVGRGIAYLPVCYTITGVKAVSDPFILDERGDIHILNASSDEYENALLARKYFVSQRIHLYVSRVIGGQFQASDNPDFSDAETVHVINEWSILPVSVGVGASRPYRYWRYLAPDGSNGNIAEIEFTEKGKIQPSYGTIIGTDGTYYPDEPETGKAAVFDGDPLTYFDAPKGLKNTYVGIDFGTPVEISKIRYIPRNDDNNVSPGDVYELFYWKGRDWKSLGKKKADSNVLYYENIPKNSLLLLRDLTKGKEERIFALENGKQVWW